MTIWACVFRLCVVFSHVLTVTACHANDFIELYRMSSGRGWWNRRVQGQLTRLIEGLRPNLLLDMLLEKEIIDMEDWAHLRDMLTEEDRSRFFLCTVIYKTDESTLDAFCSVLKDTRGQEHVATLLEKPSTDTVSTEGTSRDRVHDQVHRIQEQTTRLDAQDRLASPRDDKFELPSYDSAVKAQVFLGDRGWMYDAFICHSDADIRFVEILYHEMQKRGLRAFFCKESMEKSNVAQLTIAPTIISAPFCVVVLSDSFVGHPYLEAELKAALAFSEEHKIIIPVFYKITADDCRRLTGEMYQKLAGINGWEGETRTDEEFAKAISQDVKERAENQLHSKELKLWKPNGEDWKPKYEIGLQLLTQLKEDLNAEKQSALGDSFCTLSTTVKSSDGLVQPVTSSISSEIGPEGGEVVFQSSDVYLVVPPDAVPSGTTFFLSTYVDPSFLPPVTSKDEVTLSPAFHLSSSLPRGHHFKRPLQLFLPLEVSLRASDCDSGWLLQLKKSMSSDGSPSKWQTVLAANTKTGEFVSQSSVVEYYDHTSGTLCLRHFCRFAWIGKRYEALRSLLGFTSSPSPLRQISYAVFGKQLRRHTWMIATHIIRGSKVAYESLRCKRENAAYVELKHPNSDSIQSDGEVLVRIQCFKSWKVRRGNTECHFSTDRIWGSSQDCSCYYEVVVEDSACSTDMLECTIEASFRAKGSENVAIGHPVELVIYHPLVTKSEAATLSPPEIADSQVVSSGTPGVTETFYDSEISSDHLNAIALSVRSSWFQIGVYLKMTDQHLKEYELRHPHDYYRRLLDVLVDWTKKEDHPVIGKLVDACKEVGVGGEVKRLLNYKEV